MGSSAGSQKEVARKTKQSLLSYTTILLIVRFLRFANPMILARLVLSADLGIICIITVILN